ncbi:MAG: UDP-3-O-[3-hydroxymyristoyl] N-acetylglucosamine deacetylase [Gammaproteobacteria bacterium]|jgi:UDP-3-O-[3-hydroxymyristoyl] N-acetylglucosamine deacetylase|nr:UDP-3-O-[3-hydroxymyristoyl] N-acetylglucosamine deacetylase [Gammaproteobacteria bacterium]|tara:strand:+ start:8 stop:922 length:915 start_codon:yes stop_codon:yes gene_type:complete
MLKQRTLSSKISASGVGLHTGKKISLTINPGPVNSGIIFKRTDLESAPIKASLENVFDTRLSTSLSNDHIQISTVEHLLSALAGIGIDNAMVELDGPEVPIMDGSARPFVFMIQSAGIKEQTESKKFIKIKKTIEVKQDEKWAKIEPFDGFKVAFTIDFDHPAFSETSQSSEIDFSSVSYLSQVSRARTFGFTKDIELLRKNNLALGGSVNNAIVIDDYRVINEEGVRFQDEFVKHKILDAIGDLYLLGHGLMGSFSAYKSGHHLNNLLLRELVNNVDAWEEVTIENNDKSPIFYSTPEPAIAE